MDGETLEKIYKEHLEERLISHLAEILNCDLTQAMDKYYKSHLANRIASGEYGIQYLDYKVLAQILTETEPELFRH